MMPRRSSSTLFPYTTLFRSSLGPEFRLIKSMDIEDPYTITIRFDKPYVAFGNKVTQGLFASVAFIHSKKYIETVGEDRKSTRLNSSHANISYAVFCLKKKKD